MAPHTSFSTLAYCTLFLLVAMMWFGLNCLSSLPRTRLLSSIRGADKQLILSQAHSMLQQKLLVLDLLTDEDYCKKNVDIFNSSIGGHLRHSMDHYEALVTAASSPSSFADYDSRSRNTLVETNRKAAKDSVLALQKKLEKLDLEKNIEVSFIGETKTFTSFKLTSTVARELSFASHHGIHHMSMIKLLLQGMGYSLPAEANVGIAPSTVLHHKQHPEESLIKA
ncbi:DinB family protein [archaeon]|nr:MAG: DinB family protein [archaeon]